MRKLKWVLSTVLVLHLVFGSMMVSANESTSNDYENHWAATTIEKWIANGWITGYKDGRFKPNGNITRSEFAALINRSFEVEKSTEIIEFKDLSNKHWAYQNLQDAVKAGFMSGTGNQMISPDKLTTRQEAAVMVAKIAAIPTVEDGKLTAKDADKVAVWSKDAIISLVNEQILKGDTNGNIRPEDQLTRAEAVVLIDNALQALKSKVTTYSAAGTYGSLDEATIIKGNVVIAAADVILQNLVIEGDLTIAESVGEGDVTLQQVTVKGATIVQGGGENSIHIEDSVLLRVIVDKKTGTVRVVAIGATSVQEVYVKSAVKIEESHVTDSGFRNIELGKELPEKSTVNLIGQFEDVNVLAANIVVKVPSGSIDNLNINDAAKNNTISLDKDVKVLNLIIDSIVKIIGEGLVENATVNEGGKNSEFDKLPTNTDGAGKGDIVTKDPIVTPPGGSSNGGDSSNGGNTSTEQGAAIQSVKFENADEIILKKRSIFEENVDVVGFVPTHLHYLAVLPRDIEKRDTTITITPDKDAKVSLYINKISNTGRTTIVSASSNSATFHLEPNTEYSISATVTSGNGINVKNYQFTLSYERTLQEAFALKSNSYLNGTNENINYSLNSEVLQKGDVVTATIAAGDSSSAQEESFIATAGEYDAVPTGSYSYVNLQLTSFNQTFAKFIPATLIGEIKIVVTRGDVEIYNDVYQYNLTPIQVVDSLDGILINVLTTAELTQVDLYSNRIEKTAKSFYINISKSDLNVQFKEAASYLPIWTRTEKVSTLEDVKQTIIHGSYNLIPFNEDSNKHGFSYSYDPTRDNVLNADGKYETESTDLVYMAFFNSKGEVLGAVPVRITYTAETIGENVVLK